MKDNFDLSLKHLLVHEGGFVNHPKDPGGMTNLGVTAKVWSEWVGHDVNEKIMRELTPAKVAPLYKRKYWDAVRADELVSGLDYCVFDCAVNSGPGRAIKILQKCVGVTADGGFGSVTMAAVAQFKGEAARQLIKDYASRRLDFLKTLKTFSVFGKGWERRVNEVEKTSLEMLG